MNNMLVGLAAALACAPGLWAGRSEVGRQAPAPQGNEWSWHGTVAAGKRLEIRGVSGMIEAVPATGSAVVVTATKRGRESDPDDVRIEVVQDDGNVTICAVYPGRGNRCGAGDDYHMSTHNNDVEVRFHAEVPAGVAFTGDNVNGGVSASALAGPIEARTVNGGVQIETTAGDASASTVNGSVTAVVRGTGTGALRFETVNGGITLSLPKNLNADLEAETVNGSIDTDFPITVTGHLDRRHLDGRIGQGGRSLHLETVNGSIRLRAL
jgi:putative adhesin